MASCASIPCLAVSEILPDLTLISQTKLEEVFMFRTEICDLLGIELPIIQGGMVWVSYHALCAAVSEAGGLGAPAGGSFRF